MTQIVARYFQPGRQPDAINVSEALSMLGKPSSPVRSDIRRNGRDIYPATHANSGRVDIRSAIVQYA